MPVRCDLSELLMGWMACRYEEDAREMEGVGRFAGYGEMRVVYRIESSAKQANPSAAHLNGIHFAVAAPW